MQYTSKEKAKDKRLRREYNITLEERNKLEEFQKDIEQRDNQIKLLTDSQHKPAWWRRFGAWFIGR